MNIEYHKWYSPSLNQDMEMKVYGHYGKPMLVFPCQGGRYVEYEDFGMIKTISNFIDEGKIKVFTVDSVDNQSWANQSVSPGERARRHEDYDRYIIQEVAPFIKKHCQNEGVKIITNGFSMGGFHSANFYFRHPDVFDTAISISGLMQLSLFIGDYSDETVYFNTPLSYLSNMSDPWFFEQYNKGKIIVGVGQGAWEDEMLKDAKALKYILEQKGIPHWIDIWGLDVNHDWPWWHKMMPYFLGSLNL